MRLLIWVVAITTSTTSAATPTSAPPPVTAAIIGGAGNILLSVAVVSRALLTVLLASRISLLTSTAFGLRPLIGWVVGLLVASATGMGAAGATLIVAPGVGRGSFLVWSPRTPVPTTALAVCGTFVLIHSYKASRY